MANCTSLIYPVYMFTPERSSQPQARWFPTPCLQINKLTSQAVIVSISGSSSCPDLGPSLPGVELNQLRSRGVS